MYIPRGRRPILMLRNIEIRKTIWVNCIVVNFYWLYCIPLKLSTLFILVLNHLQQEKVTILLIRIKKHYRKGKKCRTTHVCIPNTGFFCLSFCMDCCCLVTFSGQQFSLFLINDHILERTNLLRTQQWHRGLVFLFTS